MTERVYHIPSELRSQCRENLFTKQTSSQCPGYAQANLCILPKQYAFDFLLFCQRNPKPCPLLHVLEEGKSILKQLSGTGESNIDVRTDLPRYRIYREGQFVDEITDIKNLWQEDFVTFIIGCSFSFEQALLQSNLEIRHITMDRNVPMYRTNIPCEPAGIFHGNMVVSMRPFSPADALLATQVTARYPRVHGAPLHIGNPAAIGVEDINKPDFGDPVDIRNDEVPLFWACGVTPQSVVMTSRPSICITHAPGHMLVLDTKNEELSLS